MCKNYLFKKIVFLLAIVIVAFSCGVNKTMKKGAQFESAGMFKDASDLYYKAWLKKPDKPEVKIALKRASQVYFDELNESIIREFKNGDYKATVDNYLVALGFALKTEKTGINLKMDPLAEQYYQDAKSNYLEKQYLQGQKNLMEKNYREAERIFEEVFKLDPDYKDTRALLNEAVNEPLYQDGLRLYGENKFMDAYGKWAKVAKADKEYKDVNNLMQQALNERYKEGTLLLMDENFKDAANALGDVYRVDPNFKEVKTQYIEARNEPIYRQATQSLKDGKCRTAYYSFNDIVNDAGTYKDAAQKKDQSLECAQFPIAIQSPRSPGSMSDVKDFQSLLTRQILNQKNIFIQVYDLSAINPRLDRNIGGWTGSVNVSELRELQGRNNIKAVLLLDVSDYNKETGKPKSEKKTGFVRESIKMPDGTTKNNDRQVTYMVTSQENKMRMTLNYKLVSTSTGQVFLSDQVSFSKTDNIEFATFDGDRKSLYPASKPAGSFVVNEGGYHSLQSLLKASQRIKPVEELTNEVYQFVTSKIAVSINNFNPEK